MTDHEYAPQWAERVSDDQLLHELQRRLLYKERGWQESYRSAQHWREKATQGATQ